MVSLCSARGVMAAVAVAVAVAAVAMLEIGCGNGSVIMDLVEDGETGTSTFHINTTDAATQPILINGVNVLQELAFQQQQLSLLELRLCSLSPPAADETTLANVVTGDTKFGGAELAPNGLIYGIPASATYAFILDPATNSLDTTTISGFNATRKWARGALAPTGIIYGVPGHSDSVLRIDPETNSATQLPHPSVASSSGGKWVSAVVGLDGRVYCVPWSASAVLILDPATDTMDATTFDGLGTGEYKWHSGAVASDGRLFLIPRRAQHILILDPANGAMDTTSLAGFAQGDKWFGGVQLDNGLFYAIPWNSDENFLILDPDTGTYDDTSLVSPDGKFLAAAVAPNGKIVCVPDERSYVALVDPKTNTVDVTSIGDLQQVGAGFLHVDAVTAPNGLVYFIPHVANNFVIVNPGC